MSTRAARPWLSSSGWYMRDILHCSTLITSLLAFSLVQWEVPDPYLDEIFHIPQTQQYCSEDFETWDPAITTPPGLYLLSATPLMTVHIPCSTPILRSTNLLYTTIIIPFILTSLLTSPTSLPWRPSSTALVISSFPLIFFFGNLYYTDVASLAGVLGCWALAERRRHWSASLVGAWSVTVRQTNVVWVGFVLLMSLLRIVQTEDNIRFKAGSGKAENASDPLLTHFCQPAQLLTIPFQTAQRLLSLPKAKSLKVIAPYLPTFLGFLAFLKWNGGIVLGHKDLHKPVAHVPQLLYFIAFISIMLLPSLLAEGVSNTVRGTLKYTFGSRNRIIISVIILLSMILAVQHFTIYHPFLLADNRHYAFYILRRIFLPYPAAKYAVTPLYLLALQAWAWRLRQSTTFLWTTAFLLCTSAVLIPTPLIEPRYFLIPTIILRTQITRIRFEPGYRVKSSPSRQAEKDKYERQLLVEYAWYSVINVATVALFLLRKFRWEGWEGWMRFMW